MERTDFIDSMVMLHNFLFICVLVTDDLSGKDPLRLRDSFNESFLLNISLDPLTFRQVFPTVMSGVSTQILVTRVRKTHC